MSTVESMVYSTTSSYATRRTKQQHHYNNHHHHQQQQGQHRVTFDDDYSSKVSGWGRSVDPPGHDETSHSSGSTYSAEMVSSIDGPQRKKYSERVYRNIV